MRFVRALGHLSDLLTVIASLILCHIRRGWATLLFKFSPRQLPASSPSTPRHTSPTHSTPADVCLHPPALTLSLHQSFSPPSAHPLKSAIAAFLTSSHAASGQQFTCQTNPPVSPVPASDSFLSFPSPSAGVRCTLRVSSQRKQIKPCVSVFDQTQGRYVRNPRLIPRHTQINPLNCAVSIV